MSVKIMTLVWEHAPYTSGSLIVLLALADWSNDEGISWPSMDRLARKARIDRRSAQRIIRQLAKDGIVKIEEGGGRGKQHKYLIQTERVANCRPLAEINGDISSTEKATFRTQRATSDAETVTPTSPDPLVEPLEKPSIDTSAEFLDSLKVNPAYAHVDIDLEFGRMQTWASTNRRRVTRRFVVNWLNRIEVPLGGSGQSRRAVSPVVPLRPKTATEYIEGFTRGLEIAPNYDVMRDVKEISDRAVKDEVLRWWWTRGGREGQATCTSREKALSL